MHKQDGKFGRNVIMVQDNTLLLSTIDGAYIYNIDQKSFILSMLMMTRFTSKLQQQKKGSGLCMEIITASLFSRRRQKIYSFMIFLIKQKI
jgi:hypothetical protein